MDLLIVDDDNEFRRSVSRRLKRLGHVVRDADLPTEGIELARKQSFEVALIDLMMPEMSGIELLEKLKGIDAACQVVMLTGEASIETAVAAMKRGAFDYVSKPCPFNELEIVLEKAHKHYQLGKENTQLRQVLERSAPPGEIVGETTAIRNVLKIIDKAGPTDSPILILGESGTGKELVARALHRLSKRAEKPMVTINCAALQETLLESELFGHEKGSFTGATAAKLGLFEVADGGTLFIDELGELATGLQAKLLRVLEDGSLRRVGSTREQKVDTRVITATNHDLEEEVREGRFRNDLYYRLSVLTIKMPTLRERRDDILLLIEHFLRRHGSKWQLADEACTALCNYHWPGNVRELANVLERATILADNHTIGLDDLPLMIANTTNIIDAVANPNDSELDDLAERERRHVEHVLKRERYNRNRTAEILGINRRSLYRLIDKYHIEIPEKGSGNADNG